MSKDTEKNVQMSTQKEAGMSDVEEIVMLAQRIVSRLDRMMKAEEQWGIDNCMNLEAQRRAMERQVSELKEMNQIYGG